MIESFRYWMEEIGLADPGVTDRGRPKLKNKSVPYKYGIPQIPNISVKRYEMEPGMARKTAEALVPVHDYPNLGLPGTEKLRSKAPGLADPGIKKLATWHNAERNNVLRKRTYDVIRTANTKLDPG